MYLDFFNNFEYLQLADELLLLLLELGLIKAVVGFW
jgi:hypothetical protein